jgi:CheY-like chemotaxis protein
MAHVSHDLLTPLNGIIGMLTLVLRTGLTPEQEEYLRNAAGAAEALQDYLSDLLDLSSLEAGTLETESLGFSLRAVVDRVTAPAARAMEANGLAFASRIEPGCPDDLLGDPWRIGQVLSKLLANAARFTDRGAVTLDVAGREVRPGLAEVVVTVRDTGPGIPPERIPGIFRPFEQVDGSVTRRFGGSGLGLAIGHQLAERMGACLGVESLPGHGSVFKLVLRLPVARRQARQEAAAPLLELVPEVGPRRVLLAEDNRINQLLVVRLLEGAGHEVATAETGQEALDLLAQGSFDVVLMDLQMPVMGGLEAIGRIRAREVAAGGHVMIVALTAQAAAPGDRELCLESGADAYLPKPFSAEALEAAVVRTVAAGTGPARPRPAIDRSAFEACRSCRNQGYGDCERRLARPPLDLDAALETCGGDEVLRRDVTYELLALLPREQELLQAAVASGDPNGVARSAHKLKSSLAAVGATLAGDAAAVLEQAARRCDPRLAGVAERFSCELERAVAALERSMVAEPVE